MLSRSCRGSASPNRNPSRCSLGIFFFSDEIQFGRANVGVAGQLTDFVELCSVLDRVVEWGSPLDHVPTVLL